MLLLIRSAVHHEECGSSRFTFHYASTYTYGGKCQFQRSYLFTFHYASTYTLED